MRMRVPRLGTVGAGSILGVRGLNLHVRQRGVRSLVHCSYSVMMALKDMETQCLSHTAPELVSESVTVCLFRSHTAPLAKVVKELAYLIRTAHNLATGYTILPTNVDMG